MAAATICTFNTIAIIPAIRIFRAIRIPLAATLARLCMAFICTVQRVGVLRHKRES